VELAEIDSQLYTNLGERVLDWGAWKEPLEAVTSKGSSGPWYQDGFLCSASWKTVPGSRSRCNARVSPWHKIEVKVEKGDASCHLAFPILSDSESGRGLPTQITISEDSHSLSPR
jgi:hypothetical protein